MITSCRCQRESVESIESYICVLLCPECTHKVVVFSGGSAFAIFKDILSSNPFLLRSININNCCLSEKLLSVSLRCTVVTLSKTREFESENLHRFALINFRWMRTKALF